ncbi:MAG: TIGR02147 family protein [Deltaproteobacteria bacterium]|nr:TIGR02147 family protein [Deltaproteobacteria bacterium]
MTNQDQPVIFEYTDYRKFLRDLYEYKKETTPFFSYRYFSKMAGFTSPNYFKLIMDGDRNLSGGAINKFIKALKLNIKEARFFRLLVMMNQADTAEERDFYTRQILKGRVYKTLKPLTQAQYDYYSNWYLIPMRELVGRSDFKIDPKWIARQFTPELSEAQVKDGIKTLLKLGLVEETANGSLTQTDFAITTGEDVASQAVVNYHRHMIQMGAEALDRFEAKDRDISSLTMGVGRETFKKIKAMVHEFRKEIIAVVKEDKNIDDIVQVNFQVFPLAVKKEDDHE